MSRELKSPNEVTALPESVNTEAKDITNKQVLYRVRELQERKLNNEDRERQGLVGSY